MALMLLLGTSSAWAVDYYITGDVVGNWSQGANNRLKMTAHETNIVKAVVYLTGDFKVVNGATDWTENYNQPASGTGTTLTGGKNNNFNLQLNSGYSAPITIYYNYSTKYVWAAATACTSCCGSDIFRVAGSSNLCGSSWYGNDDNNKMECSDDIFSKSYNITGNTSYTFKIVKNNSDWINTINSNASITNKIALKTTGGDNNVTLSENPSSDGKLTIYYDPNKGIYATFEKSCNTPELSDFTCTLPDDDNTKAGNEVMWNGNTHAATVIWSGTQGGTITIYYKNGDVYSEEAPSAVGEYKVYVTTTENNNFCALTTKTEVGTFTITCPAPAEVPIYSVTQATTSCKGTDNQIGIITLTNYNDAYTYKLNDNAVTITDNKITGLAADSYTISAAKTCGSAKSLPISGESVTITSTDLTPTVAKDIEISGKNEICAGESTELTCNVEPSEGTIDSYSWNQAGTKNVDKLITASLDANTNYVATVTITNDGCSKDFESASYLVTVNPVPSKPSFVTDGEVTCAEKPVNPNLSKELASGEYLVWYDASEGGTNLGSNLTSSAEDETKIYYAAVSNGACESAERTPYTVDVEADPIVDLTLTLVDGKGNSLPLNYTYCQGDDVNVKLTYNGGIYWGEPEWNSTLTAGDMNTSGLRYDALNKKGEGTYTISNLQASGTLQVALTMCGDTKATSNVLNVNITPQAETPTVEVLLNIEKCGNDIRQYGKIQISPYNAGYTYKINDTDVTPNNNGIVENLSTAGSFTLSAINSCKVSTPSAPFTISETDNKPTISISGNETAVLYEDVMLAATATDGATVKWYEGGVEKATGATYVVTSETATSKAVTAKAFLNGCESAEVSKKVTFGEETCKPTTITVPANYIEIYCKYNDAPTQHDMKVDIWKQSEGQGTESYQSCSKSVDGYAYWKFNITDDATYCIRISNKELSYKSGSMCTLTRGHKYYFDIPGGWSGWTNGPDKSKTQDITETQDGPPAITTPAVKTVSATSEEGSGTVTFTGQIIKTGCAATSKIYYGYQFKKADEEWPTTGVEASNTPVEGKLIPLTNASETALYYQFSANVENLEDVDYHFRAYIINGYDFTNGNYDQGVYYGLDKLVTVSTVQTAVTTAKIQLVDADGKEVDKNKKYCVGETGYIKVTSDVKYTTATWKSDLGVEIEQIGKTNIYQFEVKGKDQIVVLLSNKHNTEPVSSNPREVDVYASPSVPEIALGESSICDTNEDGTTLTVTRTKAGQYYALYKEDGNGGIKVEDYQLCSSDNAAIEYTGLKESAKYFVKTYRGECDSEITRSSSATLTVVDSKDVKISIEPTDTETTPWMPAKLTVTATSDYTVTSVPNDAVINISGNIVKVKLPLPTEGVQNKSTTKDNVNVTFDNITYTITAELRTAGEEGNPCAQPAIANITLTPYIEICD